jgi:hypothetical protein
MPIYPRTQYGFVAGEVSPSFYGRSDISQHEFGVAQAQNFFVDFRGGLLSRGGSKFIAPLQFPGSKMFRFRAQGNDYRVVLGGEPQLGASAPTVSSVIRFIRDGGYLLETAVSITGVDLVNGFVEATGHGYSDGDMIYIEMVAGTTELNGRYFVVSDAETNKFKLVEPVNLYMNDAPSALDLADYTAYSSNAGNLVSRVVTVEAPYTHEEVADVKVEQRYATMIFTHVDHAPRRLTYVSDTNWTFAAITYASTATAPTGLAKTTSGSGAAGAAFRVTAVDQYGVESRASAYFIADNIVDYSATAGWLKLTWTAVSGAVSYNVYRSLLLAEGSDVTSAQSVGYIGNSFGEVFIDSNITPDFTKTPPLAFNPFADNNNPRVFRIFQQRGVYAGSLDFPMTIWGSKPGEIDNFDVSDVINAGDSYSLTLDASSVEPIRHLLAMRAGLLVFTDVGVSMLRAQEGTALSPINALAEPQAYRGVAAADPLGIDLDVLYLQSNSGALNTMMFTEYTNTFKLQDISLLSNHLFGLDNQLLRLEWVPEPYKILWMPRADGALISVTYDRAQEVFGWAKHTTRGLFRDACAGQDDNKDVLYVIVSRKVNGYWRDYIEAMQPRDYEFVEDFWGVDSGLDYVDHFTTDALLNVTAGEVGDSVTCILRPVSASADDFPADIVGQYIYARGGKLLVTARTSGTEVTATVDREVEAVFPETEDITRQVAVGDWKVVEPVSTVTGLWHLEGETVSVLADGGAILSKTVTDGSISLDEAASRIIVGLPYTCRVKTLPINLREAATEHKRKDITAVGTKIYQTRGLRVGTDFDHLEEMKLIEVEFFGDEISLRDGTIYTYVNSAWGEEVQICYEQSYPLPAGILSLTTDLDVGDN